MQNESEKKPKTPVSRHVCRCGCCSITRKSRTQHEERCWHVQAPFFGSGTRCTLAPALGRCNLAIEAFRRVAHGLRASNPSRRQSGCEDRRKPSSDWVESRFERGRLSSIVLVSRTLNSQGTRIPAKNQSTVTVKPGPCSHTTRRRLK